MAVVFVLHLLCRNKITVEKEAQKCGSMLTADDHSSWGVATHV